MSDINYNQDDFVEDMAWIKRHKGVFDQIQAAEGFTNNLPHDAKLSGLGMGLIDHSLKRTFFVNYLNYQREDSQ